MRGNYRKLQVFGVSTHKSSNNLRDCRSYYKNPCYGTDYKCRGVQFIQKEWNYSIGRVKCHSETPEYFMKGIDT